MSGEHGGRFERVVLSPSSGWFAVVASERGREGILRRISDTFCYLGQREPIGQEKVARERHPPVREILHWRLSQGLLEDPCERRPGHQRDPRQLLDGPRPTCVLVDRLQRARQTLIRSGAKPCRGTGAARQARSETEHDQQIEQAVEHGLLSRLRMRHLSRQHRDDAVDRVIDARREGEHTGQRINQAGSDIACELIGAAEKHRSLRTQLDFAGGVQSAKLVGRDARRPWLMRNEVVRSSAHKREIARSQRHGFLASLGPEPYLPLDDRMDGKLDSGQPQPPRRVRR